MLEPLGSIGVALNLNLCGNAVGLLGLASASSGSSHDDNGDDDGLLGGCSSSSGPSGIVLNLNVCDNALAIAGLASSGSEFPDDPVWAENHDDNDDVVHDPGGACSSSSWASGIALNSNVCGNALAVVGLAAATP